MDVRFDPPVDAGERKISTTVPGLNSSGAMVVKSLRAKLPEMKRKLGSSVPENWCLDIDG